ncbi:MAG TPA: aminotransferase class I/II-fold pyridoxal phosphate-dependent enzyme [Bosea sp. (in: a-proteobacteria)]|jgi:8-amino-7-oxononanoate synthase|nr:aminotransferase class I/II-fold pyridoxal phosphate-dependent enzyme [Bosea sp. (in: a-proteobacteria)]
MSRESGALTDGALSALFDQMRGTSEPSNAVALAAKKLSHDVGIASHPLYQQIELQKNLATLAGLPSPYYRRHDVRAGHVSVVEGRSVVNFTSYDYLGLNGDPRILEAVVQAAGEFGTSVSASRITSGERQIHRDLEEALARNYAAEDCVAFVSGHAAAVSALATLMGPKDLIVHDSVIHNCIVVGAQLAGATRRLFPHNDFDALETQLAVDRERFQRVLIVSEGLFSMDGDGPDLERLVAIKERFAAWLMIDDAHGLGTLGVRGRGIFEHQGVDPARVDFWLGTLSKSLVSCGGYIAGSAMAVELLKSFAPGFVYSVGMPATNAAAAKAALDLMNGEPERVARLQKQSQRFLDAAKGAGLDVGDSWGAGIIPLMTGDTLATLVLAERLLARGINAFPVLPPGVPENGARVRFFVNATHSDDEIDQAVAIVAEEFDGLLRSSATGRV